MESQLAISRHCTIQVFAALILTNLLPYPVAIGAFWLAASQGFPPPSRDLFFAIYVVAGCLTFALLLRLFSRIFRPGYAAKGQWREVEMMCETLAKHAPEEPFTVFNRAEAFHRQGRSQEACELLSSALASFKKIPQYFYDYARYLCGVHEYSLALSCLGKAFDA